MSLIFKRIKWFTAILAIFFACSKNNEPEPLIERTFRLLYDSDGMRKGVDAFISLSEKSFRDPAYSAAAAIIVYKADTISRSQVETRFQCRKGDRLYLHVVFPDIANSGAAKPAMASFLSGVMYINNSKAGGTALRYSDYQNSSKRYTDPAGKVHLLAEIPIDVKE